MPTPLLEQYRLFEGDELTTKANVGTTLSSIMTAYGFPNGTDDMELTFEDDFTHCDRDDPETTLGGNIPFEGQKWFIPGNYTTNFDGSIYPYDGAAELYRQHDAGAGDTLLGMGIRNDTNISQISTFAPDPVNTPPNLIADGTYSFTQQFGFFECRMKTPDPTGSGAIPWPAFWANSINRGGGTYGNVFTNAIEIDVCEIYEQDEAVYGDPGDGGVHCSVHHHEPLRLIAPGVWGRDKFSNKITTIRNTVTWGTDSSFRFYNDFHKYQWFFTPTGMYFFFDDLEIMRCPMFEELCDKYYLLVSNAVSNVRTAMPLGTIFWQEVDYVRAWQGKDWQTTPGGNQLTAAALTGAGTANAKTVTTVQAMAAYAGESGRVIVAKWADANTGATTLNANTLGALNVYKRTDNTTVPESGELIALTGGEIGANEWKAFTLDMTLDGGTGGWVLSNSRYSMAPPAQFDPTPPSVSPITIDLEAIEAGLAEKHGVSPTLFPVGHPARTPKVSSSVVPPRMQPSTTFIRAANKTQGTSIGTVEVINTPDREVRFSQVGATTHYTTDPETGEITVASGHTTEVGVEEFTVGAWPLPPQALVPGSNHTRVIMDVREDIEFDLSFFGDNLKAWVDAQDADSLTLDTGNVASWADLSPVGLVWQRPDGENGPAYNETGLNSLPAVVVNGTNSKRLRSFLGTTAESPASSSIMSVVATRSTDLSMTVTLNGIGRPTSAFARNDLHMGMYVWSPAGVAFYANDVLVDLAASASQAGITTTGFVFYVVDVVNSGVGNGRIYDAGSGAWLFNRSTNDQAGNMALGEFAFGLQEITTALRNKIFGYAAHHWNLTTLLAANHPYKVTAPRMWE